MWKNINNKIMTILFDYYVIFPLLLIIIAILHSGYITPPNEDIPENCKLVQLKSEKISFFKWKNSWECLN